MFGQMFAVQRHYINYADLLKIRYSNIPCLVMVGTEDRLVRESNSYMLRRVCFLSDFINGLYEILFRRLAADSSNSNMQDTTWEANVLNKSIRNY